MAVDVGEADFEQRVIERSREVPVVVDFWAEWCAPCRALGPALEEAAKARDGRVDLAKLDVDSNPAISQAFRVQGIPAVKAFKDGRLVDEFTGVVPRAAVDSFLRGLMPSEADRLAALGDEESVRRALELQPNHPAARAALIRIESAGDPVLAPALEALERGEARPAGPGPILPSRARRPGGGGTSRPAGDPGPARRTRRP